MLDAAGCGGCFDTMCHITIRPKLSKITREANAAAAARTAKSCAGVSRSRIASGVIVR